MHLLAAPRPTQVAQVLQPAKTVGFRLTEVWSGYSRQDFWQLQRPRKVAASQILIGMTIYRYL